MAAPASTGELLDLVRKSGIVAGDALAAKLQASPRLPDDAGQSAALLVRQGVLTPFQAKLLLAGRYRGFRLGAYVILEQLGQGGMGTVYLAEHETLRRRVAIKVLAPTEGVNKVAVERFLREARAAAALDHPNIVRIFDVAQQGDLYYLAMEYVDGQTLEQLVDKQGALPCGRAVELVLQAAVGLQHAYEKGLVHRDIKPANLIVARDGTVKVLDLGLARSFEVDDRLTEVYDKGAVVGTADYISPEQAMNSPDLDIRADIYSLGATFFTLVTGRPPFEGNTTQKLLQHQLQEPPSLDSIDRTFPEGLADVVVKMLRKRPADRYRTPAEVVAALGPWLPNGPRVPASLSRPALTPAFQTTLAAGVTNSTRRLPRFTPHPGLTPVPAPRVKPWWLPWLLVGGVFGGVTLGVALAFAVSGLARPPEPPAKAAPPQPRNSW